MLCIPILGFTSPFRCPVLLQVQLSGFHQLRDAPDPRQEAEVRLHGHQLLKPHLEDSHLKSEICFWKIYHEWMMRKVKPCETLDSGLTPRFWDVEKWHMWKILVQLWRHAPNGFRRRCDELMRNCCRVASAESCRKRYFNKAIMWSNLFISCKPKRVATANGGSLKRVQKGTIVPKASWSWNHRWCTMVCLQWDWRDMYQWLQASIMAIHMWKRCFHSEARTETPKQSNGLAWFLAYQKGAHRKSQWCWSQAARLDRSKPIHQSISWECSCCMMLHV